MPAPFLGAPVASALVQRSGHTRSGCGQFHSAVCRVCRGTCQHTVQFKPNNDWQTSQPRPPVRPSSSLLVHPGELTIIWHVIGLSAVAEASVPVEGCAGAPASIHSCVTCDLLVAASVIIIWQVIELSAFSGASVRSEGCAACT